jgi:hypothetical protein
MRLHLVLAVYFLPGVKSLRHDLDVTERLCDCRSITSGLLLHSELFVSTTDYLAGSLPINEVIPVGKLVQMATDIVSHPTTSLHRTLL